MTQHDDNVQLPDSSPEQAATAAHEPMLNIPPATLTLVLVLLAIHLGFMFALLRYEEFLLNMPFVPAAFSANPLRYAHTLLGSAFLHAGWGHLAVNCAGLLAFGSGIERMLGKRFMLAVFAGGAIAGTLGYWAIFPSSPSPLVGASAGISALFGACLPLIVRRPQWLAASILFILANIALGYAGVPHDPVKGAEYGIAWQAHIAGFLFGEAVIFLWIRNRLSRFKNRGRTAP